MKKIFFLSAVVITLFLFSCQPGTPESDREKGIVGRWEYLKTVNSDGTEDYRIMGIEHYYADGRVVYLNMWLQPLSLDSIPKTRDELLTSFDVTDGGMGTYEVNPEKNWLKISLETCTDTALVGKSFELKYEIKEDTMIFRDSHYFIRIKG